MVYTDGIHLIADSLEELHSFAARIGLRRCWYDPNPKHPHYDLMKGKVNRQIMYAKAVCAGAEQKTSRELITIIQRKALVKFFSFKGKIQ